MTTLTDGNEAVQSSLGTMALSSYISAASGVLFSGVHDAGLEAMIAGGGSAITAWITGGDPVKAFTTSAIISLTNSSMHKIVSKPVIKMLVQKKLEAAGWTELEYSALPDGTNDQLQDIAMEAFYDLFMKAGGRTKLVYSSSLKPGELGRTENATLIKISDLHKTRPLINAAVTIGHELIHAVDYFTGAIGDKDYYFARSEQHIYNSQIELSEVRAYNFSFQLTGNASYLEYIGLNMGFLFNRGLNNGRLSK
jgi:hypothetical protein